LSSSFLISKLAGNTKNDVATVSRRKINVYISMSTARCCCYSFFINFWY